MLLPPLQNGEVFIFTGMLEAVADVHQLTVVLGHEMAHAVLGHSVITHPPPLHPDDITVGLTSIQAYLKREICIHWLSLVTLEDMLSLCH